MMDRIAERSPKKAAGEPIRMSSIKLDLGEYVIARPRKNGTYNVVFKVPDKLRPSGWLPVRPLPRTGTRTGNLRDPEEVARILADGAALHVELRNARLGRQEVGVKPFTIPHLVDEWQKSDRWLDHRDDGGYAPRTKNFYQKVINAHIMPWSIAYKHPDVRGMTRLIVTQFLRTFKKKPYVQRQVRSTLAAMLGFARDELGWISENPATDRKLRMPKRAKVVEWMESDVDFYGDVAKDLGWIGGRRLVRALWETTARITDAIVWRRGEHYDPETGQFDYDTEKTDEQVAALPISGKLRAMFDEPRTLYLILDRDGSPYRPVVDDMRLVNDFKWLQRAAVARGGRKLVLRQLRHSAVNDALDKGATREDVQGGTAHTTDQTVKIYERRSAKRAVRLQKARGLID